METIIDSEFLGLDVNEKNDSKKYRITTYDRYGHYDSEIILNENQMGILVNTIKKCDFEFNNIKDDEF